MIVRAAAAALSVIIVGKRIVSFFNELEFILVFNRYEHVFAVLVRFDGKGIYRFFTFSGKQDVGLVSDIE